MASSAEVPGGKRLTVVYADGIFDLFHAGHLSFLRKAKALGGPGARLAVGVITDEDAAWKRRPVVAHADRVEMLRHCTLVDRVIAAPPLIVTVAFLDENGLDIAVHGDDDRQERYFGEVIAAGRMRYVPYEKSVSTTILIERIRARASD